MVLLIQKLVLLLISIGLEIPTLNAKSKKEGDVDVVGVVRALNAFAVKCTSIFDGEESLSECLRVDSNMWFYVIQPQI